MRKPKHSKQAKGDINLSLAILREITGEFSGLREIKGDFSQRPLKEVKGAGRPIGDYSEMSFAFFIFASFNLPAAANVWFWH